MEHALPRPARRRAGPFARLAGLFAARRQRVRLADLDDHLLDDIGISRATAEYEASRPVWDAPERWRR